MAASVTPIACTTVTTRTLLCPSTGSRHPTQPDSNPSRDDTPEAAKPIKQSRSSPEVNITPAGVQQTTCRLPQSKRRNNNPCNQLIEPGEPRSARNNLFDLITEGRVASFFLIKISALIMGLYSALCRPPP